ncbi:MAG: D-glycero-beta-D-manno-heptose-7-phosphate kinase [Armatimonadetes bacterium]|nr:D-glycero-beta-D-manno-heptose-7-phosphate kinase [Armatimonadota bacterium]
MNPERLKELLAAFARQKVLVVGDVMVDEHIWGTVSRISPEAPVMIVEAERQTFVPGGAANVVSNIQALGASAKIIGVVGEDEAGQRLAAALSQKGIDISDLVADPSRPTTTKTRIIAHSQQVVRVDREKRHKIAPDIADRIAKLIALEYNDSDAVLISDYNKGLIVPGVVEEAVANARRQGKCLTANPKPSNLPCFKGADMVSLNQSEMEQAVNAAFEDESQLIEAGHRLRAELEIKSLVVTRGGKGILLFEENWEATRIPTVMVDVYDVAGAGDTAISAMTLALCAGASPVEAGIVATCAGTAACRKVGVDTVTCEEIEAIYCHGQRGDRG